MGKKQRSEGEKQTPLGMSEISGNSLRQNISQGFLRFSEQTSGSPMYEFLSRKIAQDHELVDLASHSDPKQPVPNLFLASVNYLLSKNSQDPLAAFYPNLGGHFSATDVMFQCFQDFCRKFAGEIRTLLKSRLVQTNEIQRCALLLPALNWISQETKANGIALIDVGCSGGLNLLLDQVHVQYSDGTVYGDSRSDLHLLCDSRGSTLPPLNHFEIKSRVGIDLNTVNLLDDQERQWNLALVWPDQPERIERVRKALGILRRNSIQFLQGSANQILSKAVADIPKGELLCLMHSFVLNQFSKEDRELFDQILVQESFSRDLWRISLEWIGTEFPELIVTEYTAGLKRSWQKLAECHGHGEWIRYH